MSKQPTSNSAELSLSSPTKRRAYQSPHLQKHGSVKNLTQSGPVGVGVDGGMYS